MNTKLHSIGLAAFGAAAITIVGVEDSATSVKAAVAAQIKVIGFAADASGALDKTCLRVYDGATCLAIVRPVLLCQLCKGLAFPANGVVMGGLDWGFATVGIWAGTALCLALVHGLSSPPSLGSIWLGLAAFMASQTLFSAARVASRTGPWAVLFAPEEEQGPKRRVRGGRR